MPLSFPRSHKLTHVVGLRKGKSRGLEKGHTLILGWSAKVAPLVNEIAMANESEGFGVIVILADMDKEEMEAYIDIACDLRNTRVVCRSGEPTKTIDLSLVSLTGAKSIVVLADTEKHIHAEVSDADLTPI